MIWKCEQCGFTITDPVFPVRCKCGSVDYGPGVPTFKKVARFATAATKHILRGSPKCEQWEIDERLAICHKCQFYIKHEQRCSRCGCCASSRRIFLNKLAWRDQQCPDGRWPAMYSGVPKTRHCLFHLYPTKANSHWLMNVGRLVRGHVFNGRKYAAIATDENSESFEYASQVLKYHGFTCFEVFNDPVIRETVSFKLLLDRVRDVDPEDAIFYAHSKGGPEPGGDIGAVERWRNWMYHKLLDEWEPCMKQLRHGAAVGINLMTWTPDKPIAPTRLDNLHHWFFAGTFFWFRAGQVFQRAWDDIPEDRYTVECWLGNMFSANEVISRWNMQNISQAYVASAYPEETDSTPFISVEQLAQHSLTLASMLPPDVDGVVAIPRSGLMPAALVAAVRNIPLFLSHGGSIQLVPHGRRLQGECEMKKLVLIDDSVGQGATLNEHDWPGLRAAVYCWPESQHKLDYVVYTLEKPHLFAWSFANGVDTKIMAFDMDGVICHNVPHDNIPLYLPRSHPVTIITSRPESDRERTEKWLKQYGVCPKEIRFWPYPVSSRTVASVAKWKVEQALTCDVDMYVESEPNVADEMRRYGIRVLCPAQGFLK